MSERVAWRLGDRFRMHSHCEKSSLTDHYQAPWTLSGYTAFKALLSARLVAAIWCNISDCDETYNYWEPLHYMMYGSGFQTWEYSPTYSIRSYAYILIHAIPTSLYSQLIQPNRILVFFFLRCVLAFSCALCEVYFYRGVCKQFGSHVGRMTLLFLILSTGMFISSSALLPSSFSMYMTMLAMGGWFLGTFWVSILAVAASAIIGWPFAGVLGIPIAFDLVVRKKRVLYFFKMAGVFGFSILCVSAHIDSTYYGKAVITPLNIILYNVFSGHGPDLYGVEPWSYYLINGLLNFNMVFVLSFLALPLTYMTGYILDIPVSGRIPSWLRLLAMYIWLAIFFLQPHKEERFLFPVYPLVALHGAVALDCIQKLYCHVAMGLMHRKMQVDPQTKTSPYQHYTKSSAWLAIAFSVAFTLLSVSRSLALYKGYHAPLDVYMEMNWLAQDTQVHTLPADKAVHVCVGKEWHRYTSSFFLPNTNWHLQFIQSEFKGQLPKPYGNSSSEVPSQMNDMNLEEPSRYIDVKYCHYLIDLDLPQESALEPRYTQMSNDWKVIASHPFLDAPRSHQLFRSFYIPWVTSHYCQYANYTLLKTTRTKNKKAKQDS
ncbi:PREDICTED: alpha-1,2-mannosyltransferase ALG9-like isoform X2 [Priapulus caudatus]|uniref:Mannosyltransferase n=1 Tax=Priapulus caudatus TaxID=37621 RepID=A0ABM1F5T0_PRICU|nr:PREDICTED: alpha-1,2-mannosyltransferase ALG9-like isoform X2 [Priapulus caudatus]